MAERRPTRADAEQAFRELLRNAELTEPDEILPHEDGILCLWHAQKVAVVIDLEDPSLPPAPAPLPPV